MQPARSIRRAEEQEISDLAGDRADLRTSSGSSAHGYAPRCESGNSTSIGLFGFIGATGLPRRGEMRRNARHQDHKPITADRSAAAVVYRLPLRPLHPIATLALRRLALCVISSCLALLRRAVANKTPAPRHRSRPKLSLQGATMQQCNSTHWHLVQASRSVGSVVRSQPNQLLCIALH